MFLSWHPCLPLSKTSDAARLLRSTGVTPLRRYCEPRRRRLVVSRFPGVTGYTTDLLHRCLGGTRTVSPVARHALVTVLPLTTPPEWQAASSARALSCCLRPEREGSASGIILYRGHHWVHLRCGPVTRSPSHGWLRRSASSGSFPPRMRPKLRRFLTLPPVGLSPTEHASLSWTHSFARTPPALSLH